MGRVLQSEKPWRYIMGLPSNDLDGLANFLENLVLDLRQQSENQKRLADARGRVKTHRQKIQSLKDLARSLLSQGRTADQVQAHLATMTNMDTRHLVRLVHNQARALQRDKRNRWIMGKVVQGWTNKQIADHLGLAEKSVARIISGERKKQVTAPTVPARHPAPVPQ